MYGNMTREEMIQRLYEGNFTTGELERQLIAKLFEQCCGGGGSSGGETLIVEIEPADDKKKFNKTAKEVFDACKTSDNVVFVETKTETDPDYGDLITTTIIYSLCGIQHATNGIDGTYTFVLTDTNPSGARFPFACYNDNDYPITAGR